MGRRKLDWEQLKARGCKRGRWMARKREQEGPLPVAVAVAPAPVGPDAETLAAYVAAVKREWETFAARCVPTETLTRQYGAPFDWPDAGPGYKEHGAFFNWQPCYLTRCRDFAQEVVNDSTKSGTWAHELSARFLEDLATGAARGIYLDVESAKNCERMLETFGDPEEPIPMLRHLAMCEFLCWKKSDGDFRFPDEELLQFHPSDIRTMDAAFLAQQAVAQN